MRLLPRPVDEFAAEDAERQFVARFVMAGYTPEEAQAKVRGLLHQLALAWGLEVESSGPAHAAEEAPEVGMSMAEAMERRRAWRKW